MLGECCCTWPRPPFHQIGGDRFLAFYTKRWFPPWSIANEGSGERGMYLGNGTGVLGDREVVVDGQGIDGDTCPLGTPRRAPWSGPQGALH